MTDTAAPPKKKRSREIDGFTLSDRPSDGETMCTGCWDESDHNTEANTNIRKGAPVYYRECFTDCGFEYDAYCRKCALEYNSRWEMTDEEAREFLAGMRAK